MDERSRSTNRQILDRVQITAPCPARWEDMVGDDRTRFCETCQLHVHDLSRMTRDEALALLRPGSDRLCLRVWRRTDGRVLTSDCTARARQLQGRRRVAVPLAAAGLLALAHGLGCVTPKAARRDPTPCQTTLVKTGRGEETVVVVGMVAPTAIPDPNLHVYPSEQMEKLPLR